MHTEQEFYQFRVLRVGFQENNKLDKGIGSVAAKFSIVIHRPISEKLKKLRLQFSKPKGDRRCSSQLFMEGKFSEKPAKYLELLPLSW